VNTQLLQVPPSAQRLQEAQRQQAEQEARLQQLIHMQQLTQGQKGPPPDFPGHAPQTMDFSGQPTQTLTSSWQGPPIPRTQVQAPDGWHKNGPGHENFSGQAPQTMGFSAQPPQTLTSSWQGPPIPQTQVQAPDGWHKNGPGHEEWVGGGPSIHERPCGTNQHASSSYAGQDTLDAMEGAGMDPHRSIGPTKPPDLVMSQQNLMPQSTGQLERYPFPQEEVEGVKSLILAGQLRVSVYNENLQLEPKRLALHPNTRRISILSDAGLCEDSWEIDNLRCITEGIASTILPDPPLPELCMAFRFKFSGENANVDTEDRFLCVVFEDWTYTLLATEAFHQLCDVPIQRPG